MNPSPLPQACASGRGGHSLKKALQLNGWLAIATATYVVTLFLVRQHADWSPPLKVAVTLVPVIPGLFFVRKGLRVIGSMDELQRKIQFESWLWAAIGTVIVSTVMNVLNAQGIRLERYPHGLELGGAYMTMFLLWCVTHTIANYRYR